MADYYHRYDWLFAIGVIFFLMSAWGIGANDVANSYATSVAARTLTMGQAAIIATCTEFVGAVALGSRVSSTIRSGILSVDDFMNDPGALLLAMVCAEVGSALWLLIATTLQFPVSTTQSIVGALVGVGIAADVSVTWGWEPGSVSQIAASWGIAPCIAAAFGFIIFFIIKYSVLERQDQLKWGLRFIPLYIAVTCAILALFITIEGSRGIPDLDTLGADAAGIVLGVFGGALIVAYAFFLPYFHRRLVKEDRRLRLAHVILGPTLWKEDPWIPFPRKSDHIVIDYYDKNPDRHNDEESKDHFSNEKRANTRTQTAESPQNENVQVSPASPQPSDRVKGSGLADLDKIPKWNPKYWALGGCRILSHGMTTDVIGVQSKNLQAMHNRAAVYDNKTEHLFTIAQTCSAMLMSIAHGSNDIANAVGPFSAEFMVWKNSAVYEDANTPSWILAVAALTLALGFAMYGFHIMRGLGNKVTRMSPSRGFAMELAAAITVLMASRLSLPVSTTQCVTGGIIGVSLVSWDLKTLNWKQLGWIFIGWVLTVPCAGLIAGIIMAWH